MTNYTKSLWEFMKSCGHWSEFKDWDDYQKKELKIGQTEEEHTKDYNDWHDNLGDKEDFDTIFENDKGG